MPQAAKTFDVIIVGAGVTGIAAAYHLQQLGVDNILLLDHGDPVIAASAAGAGYLAGGLLDNFTRIENAHGVSFAKSLWQLGDQAFDETTAFCLQHKVDVHRGRRLRLITSEPELKEAQIAVKLMKECGLPAELHLRRGQTNELRHFSERVVAVQIDGDRSAYVDAPKYLAALRAKLNTKVVQQRVTSLRVDGKQVHAVTVDGKSDYIGQMVIACNHLSIGHLIPAMMPALVSYADQWGKYDCSASPEAAQALKGSFITANHTHEWGIMAPGGQMHFGGGRYLRKMAGIEATEAVYEQKIEQHLLQQLTKTFRLQGDVTVTKGAASLECRPCDELPVIGPMFGEDRVLLASGYMGQGLTFGFFAGRQLANLVARGKAEDLLERLLPRRLRSLPESV